MRVHYILDEGLACPCQTGVGLDTVASLQNAIKYLVKNKHVVAAKAEQIEVYPLGVTLNDYKDKAPLKPDDKLPTGSTSKNAIFVHVPRDYQELTPEERKLYANPQGSPDKKAPESPKKQPMARPEGGQLKMTPKSPTKAKSKPCTVTVRCKDGKQFKKVIDPRKDKIDDLKRKFEPDSGVPADNQKLSLNGKELDHPKKTADDYGIKDGTVIDLEPKTIQVFVKTPEGKKIPVRMKPSQKVQLIKEKVAPEAGVDVEDQVLKFKGKELPNEKSADDCGLKDGDVIDLMPNTIQVHVRTPASKMIPVRMKPSDKVQFIKDDIAPKTGMPADEQVLKYNDKELKNDKSAKDSGLKDGSVIDLMPNTIEVKVKTPDNKILPVRMKPTDPVENIKKDIAPKTGMPVDKQVLKHNGNELQNNRSATDSGLKDGSVVDLMPNTIEVKVRTPDKKLLPVRMRKTDPIKSIKQNIEPKVKIPAKEQVLKHNGKELDNKKSAIDSGLKDGSIIDLMPNTIEVIVKTPDNKMIPVRMKPTDKIQFIKQEIHPKVGMPPDKQTLKHKGTELPTNKSANDCGLKDGSVIDLVPFKYDYTPTPFDTSTQRCWYQLGDTVPYYIRINGWEKIGDLKERIVETRGARGCAYLVGLPSASDLKIYPKGIDEDNYEGAKPMAVEEVLPTDTSFEEPLYVMWDGAPE